MTNITIELPGVSDWFDTIKARHEDVERKLSAVRGELENHRAMLDDIRLHIDDIRLHSFPPFEQAITPHKDKVDDYDII